LSIDGKKSNNDEGIVMKLRRKNSNENINAKIKNLYYYDYFELNSLLQKIASSS